MNTENRINPLHHNAGLPSFHGYAREMGPNGDDWGDLMVFGYPHSDIGPFIYLEACDIVNEDTEQETLQSFIIRLSMDQAVLLATRLLEAADDTRLRASRTREEQAELDRQSEEFMREHYADDDT